jgi:hypothetical protein
LAVSRTAQNHVIVCTATWRAVSSGDSERPVNQSATTGGITLHQASKTEPFSVRSAAANVTATEANRPATIAHCGSQGTSSNTSHASPTATTYTPRMSPNDLARPGRGG